MSFVAAIDSAVNIATWSRVVISLAAILEHICISISAEALTLLAINSSRTTHGEIVFDRGFFHDYEFQTGSILPEGFLADENDYAKSAFSFVVSSKHMLVLFKNLDAHNLNYICLQVNCHSNTPAMRRNKLLVEVLTKKLLVKKYQMSYLPVEHTATTVGTSYKAEVQDGRGHFYMMETAIMKQFFDMVPLGTEDFSIDIKTAKILFGAYTKQVVKEREYLKQPMLMTISMAVNELMDTNLGDTHVSLSFRLKDFRNFIALCMALKLDLGESEYYGPDPHYEAYFKEMGDPIFFESRTQNLVVRFIQFTADDSGVNESKKYVLPAPTILRAAMALDVEPTKRGEKRKTGAPEKSFRQKTVVPEKIKRLQNLDYSDRSPQRPDYDDFSAFDDGLYNMVTYGKRMSSPEKTPPPKAKEGDDTDYSTSDSEKNLGPTQMTNKPKSLFE